MDNVYYLDEQGVIQLLSSISAKIKEKTSKEILVTETTDPETGEIIKTAVKPNNFATTGSVVNYLKNRSKLIINQQITQQSASSSDNENYVIEDTTTEYNGEDEAQITMNLASAEDIASLFANWQ
jgi:hypothetical protein